MGAWQWIRIQRIDDTAAGNKTAIVPCNLNNSAIPAGDLLLTFICTQGTTSGVSDNINGAWTKIGSVANGGVELSVWMLIAPAIIAGNALKVTATTTNAHGIGSFEEWGSQGVGGVNGALDHFGTNTGTSTAPNASAINDSPGNMAIFVSANGGNITAYTAGTGDTPQQASGVSNAADCSLNYARLTGATIANNGDTNTGLRSGGESGGTSVAWAAMLMFFVGVPVSAFKSTQKRRVIAPRPRAIVTPAQALVPVATSRKTILKPTLHVPKREIVVVAPVTPTAPAASSVVVQKRKVKPRQPFPLALVAPPTPTVLSTSTAVRLRPPPRRPRGRISIGGIPIPPPPVTEGCVTLTDAVDTTLILSNSAVTNLAQVDAAVTTLLVTDILCR